MSCPYRGLLPFFEKDAEFFFGRDRFLFGEEQSTPGLIQVVQTQPLVALIGSSGSGKSSAIFAGLIPQLRTEGRWLIDNFRPQDQPFNKFAAALVRLLEPNLDNRIQQLRQEVDLAVDLMQGNLKLSNVVSKILEVHPGKRLLLIIDQFEEIYTLCPSETQYQFIDLLLDAISIRHLTLVLTIRADFYGYVLSYPPFGEALQRFTPKLLSSMNQEELRSSIEKPLERLGVSLESGLPQRILDDVGKEPGNLPLLEFTLSELWKKQKNGKLTHSTYNEIGGVKRAIANYAEEVYSKLSEVQQKQAQSIFTQLVCPGRGTEDTRRVATFSEIGAENWSLVNNLSSYVEYSTNPIDQGGRLLVTGWDEGKSENSVEIVHEALIREWKRLQDWIADDRKFRTWQESLRSSIQSWENSRRNASALLRGMLLVEAENWIKQRSNAISLLEKEFIQKSKQKERLARCGFASLGIILGSLLIFAQRQFSESQFREKLFTVLIGGSASPELISILDEELRIAGREVNEKKIDAAVESYKTVLTATQNFQKAIPTEANRLQNEDLEKVIKTQEIAERSLAKVVEDAYIPDLERQLGETPPQIGNLMERVKVTNFENQFTKGALKTTYTILMRKPGLGADKNNNGRLDANEVIYLPCDTLRKIEMLWKQATKNQCGFYKEDLYSAPGCKELSEKTLSFNLFELSDSTSAIKNRIKSCLLPSRCKIRRVKRKRDESNPSFTGQAV